MSNVFDTDNAPLIEPTEIIAGNFIVWRRNDLSTDYPPATYTLSYEFRSQGSPSRQFTVIGAEDSGDYLMQILSAASVDFEIFDYQWSAYITRNSDSERIRIDSGFCKVTPDRALDSSDPRSFAKKRLDEIEDAIESRCTNHQLDVLAYSLGVETSATRDPVQLLKWRTKFRREVIDINQRANAKKGRRPSNYTQVVFK